jgi:hypothetical protein
LAKDDFIIENDFQAWSRRLTGKNDRKFKRLHKHSSAYDIRELVPTDLWEISYKFAFVRHPVGRAISFYNYVAGKAEQRSSRHLRNAWYATPPGRTDDPNNWPAMKVFVATDSFSAFIRHPDLAAARGMQPQSDFLCDPQGNLLVDFVGKFEQLQEDMTSVQDAIGIPRRALSQRNTSRESSSGRSQPSADDVAYLATTFEMDFVRFGYDASP